MSGRVCRALLHRSTILKSGVITDDGCKEQRSAEHQERSLDGTLWRIVISAPKTATLWCIARTKLCFYLHGSATEDLPPPHGRSGSGKRKGHRVQRYEGRTTQAASAARAADGCREETAVLPSLLWCSCRSFKVQCRSDLFEAVEEHLEASTLGGRACCAPCDGDASQRETKPQCKGG